MKTAIVTGASGGIGLATVERLISGGYFVSAIYNKNDKPLINLGKRLKKEGKDGYLFIYSADFTDLNSIEKVFNEITNNFKHIDLLVNNAGIDLYKLLSETTLKEWQELFNVNLNSAFILSKLSLKSMIERKEGNIINISSIWGKSGASMEVAYSASKAALIGFTKALSKEVAESGIRVNCICPGVIDTKMNACFNKKEMQEIIDKTPLKRLGKPTEIADLIWFLASEKSSFITGEVITCDGGFAL